MKQNPWPVMLATMPVTTTPIGCSVPPDERAQRIADESMRRQAEQNRVIADQTKQSTETTKSLLEADKATRQELVEAHRELIEVEAKSREELLAMQNRVIERDAAGREELAKLTKDTHTAIQTERQNINCQRDAIEQERREIAKDRQRTPVIAAAISQVGLILACLSPLLLAVYILFVIRTSGVEEDHEVVRMLIDQVVVDDRPLLTKPDDTHPNDLYVKRLSAPSVLPASKLLPSKSESGILRDMGPFALSTGGWQKTEYESLMSPMNNSDLHKQDAPRIRRGRARTVLAVATLIVAITNAAGAVDVTEARRLFDTKAASQTNPILKRHFQSCSLMARRLRDRKGAGPWTLQVWYNRAKDFDAYLAKVRDHRAGLMIAWTSYDGIPKHLVYYPPKG